MELTDSNLEEDRVAVRELVGMAHLDGPALQAAVHAPAHLGVGSALEMPPVEVAVPDGERPELRLLVVVPAEEHELLVAVLVR